MIAQEQKSSGLAYFSESKKVLFSRKLLICCMNFFLVAGAMETLLILAVIILGVFSRKYD